MIDSTPAVNLKNVSKQFGDVQAVQFTDLQISHNEFFSILGPSGCGKTTLMRLIAGFESVTSGSIELSGKDVTAVSTRERDLNMLFQNYALFPHLTVYENVAFELRVRKFAQTEIHDRTLEAIKLVQMEELSKRLPEQLSGGQKQRVALARAIVGKTSIVLPDEPLGALDKQLRKDMQFELKRLQREVGCTFIYVTHDQEEALSMSDRIAVMRSGLIHQVGAPQEIYNTPKTKFVATFIGDCNMFEGEIDSSNSNFIVNNLGSIPILKNNEKQGNYSLMVRPENISIHSAQPAGWALPGEIIETNYLGSEWRVKVAIGGDLQVLVSTDPNQEINEALTHKTKLWVSWSPEHNILVKKD
jgi:spermidine/putrescine transport system ATP-binding protein